MLDEKKDFQGKFARFLDILANDKKKLDEFLSASTAEQSYKIACDFVGEMDFNSYNAAMKLFSKEFRKNSTRGKHEVTEGNLSRVAGGLGLDYNSSLFAPLDWVTDINRLMMPLLQQYEAGTKIGAMLEKLF